MQRGHQGSLCPDGSEAQVLCSLPKSSSPVTSAGAPSTADPGTSLSLEEQLPEPHLALDSVVSAGGGAAQEAESGRDRGACRDLAAIQPRCRCRLRTWPPGRATGGLVTAVREGPGGGEPWQLVQGPP